MNTDYTRFLQKKLYLIEHIAMRDVSNAPSPYNDTFKYILEICGGSPSKIQEEFDNL